MNNFANIDKINTQLERADLQKSILIRRLYKEYELYLNLLRDILYISVEKGLNELYSYLSIEDNFINADAFICFFDKKISKLIHMNLPLITIEQLKINKIEKKIKKEIDFNSIESSIKLKDSQKEEFQSRDDFQFEESIQFKINEDVFDSTQYYQFGNHDKLVSIDLDKNDHNNYLSNNNIFKNIGLEKQFISSLLELIEVIRVEKPRHSEKDNNNQKEASSKNKSIDYFDLIDKSLEKLLLNLSYKINQELFKANLIKKIISKDSFEYLVGKKVMIKHPHPFVINFEFNINQSSSSIDNISSIIFLNISTVELEFRNLNLSIKKNKINELKHQFQRLIKKETYWRQKEITLNKIR